MTTVKPEKMREVAERLRKLGVRDEDLVENFVRAGGPGGQKVNKTSVAVHLLHAPSGVEVKAQETRSQATNRFLARRKLADKLEAQELHQQTAKQQRIAKIRRQKRKRSKRAKEKILSDKHHQSEKKHARRAVRPDKDD